MYKFSEIKCPGCGHRFMWIENTSTARSYRLYRRIGYDEELESTVCPKCRLEMAVAKESGLGIDIKDKILEVACTIRGL